MSDVADTHVAHHFDNATQQIESSKFGLWLFLVTEVLLFGGLFVAYFMFRALYPQMFADAHTHMNKFMGAANTVILLSSSFFMTLAVHDVRENKPIGAARLMTLTFLCGLAFMIIKYFEYSAKFEHHLFPADPGFSITDLTHGNPKIFFSLYFLMTGLHGCHVLAGMGVLAWIIMRTRRYEFSRDYYTPVELTGLYWHLVDMIWIYLFPLLYLIE